MTLQFFTLPASLRVSRIASPKHNPAFADPRCERDRPFTKSPRTNRIRLVAAWRVNGETGRLECIWMLDAEPDTGGGLRRLIERAGLLLAVYQHGRFAA